MAQFYIGNAFSLNMLSGDCQVRVINLTLHQAKHYVTQRNPTSVVGHADTAAIMEGLLGTLVPMNRASLNLGEGDELLVGQYSGPRLPEGAATLPEGATIRWILVTVEFLDYL